ncbi:hypothetical protein NOR_02444 [Metarhizium rileyi]|uniref:Immunoglobulin variable region used by the ITC63B heavy chain n=1 Tax=Metarhizium rileyi (strain RCEF 4871) TaxID=1649241 RepID=A0A162JNK1_METRR|nr:hypothetical protein NOR_02444 [Metarhizium rileyi RCEF 4871]
MRWIIYLSRRCIDYTHQVALWDFMFGSRLDGTGWNPTTLGFLLDDKPGTSSESDDAAQRSRSPKFHGGSEPAVGTLAAFLAALMLPFYRFMGLTPQFPHPKMYPVNNKNLSSTKKPGVLGYLRDIRYFMTLSMHPPSLGSVLWSVFWQPDIDCNLVSPWLASFIDVLDQTINSGNLEILLKVLAFRRPRVAVWWLALFLLGDLSVLHWFRRYAETQMEKRASGSLSSPDPMVSAWSGAKQSFLDYEKTKQYTGPEDLVSTEDLLRCKLVFKLQDRSFSALSWRPFGHIKMQNVEPELWPYLQSDYSCTYHSFAWYENGNLLSTSLGFRSETGRDVKHVPDDVARRRSEVSCHKGCQHDIKLEPSRVTTLKMLSLLVHDITGDRNWANTGLPLTCLQHRWLRDWQGLDYVDTSVDGEQDTTINKPPSPFLMEWIHCQAKRSRRAYS